MSEGVRVTVVTAVCWLLLYGASWAGNRVDRWQKNRNRYGRRR